MAATRLIAMHVQKARSIQQCIKDRTDYAENCEKTEGGSLISAYECEPQTAAREFAVSQNYYSVNTGRPQHEYFDDTFMERFHKIIDNLLLACKYDGFRESYFDLKTFDVVINNTQKKSQGQGYRAFINVILSMAMQEYLKKYGVYRPNIFVMDSPILSLKEDVDASEQASDSMKASLFKYFINNPCAEQIIIIENEIPKIDYTGVNKRQFTTKEGFWKSDPNTYQN